MSKKRSCVRRVRTQRKTPITRVKKPQTVTNQPEILSQPRIGVMIPGRVMAKVTKMKTALAMPAATNDG